MVISESSVRNIMGGMETTGSVRLHSDKRKLKQRFDVIKKLGQGTYGKVQLGINKETGQEVAIKTIKKCKIETEADLVRIRREIQIMSSMQHPNIIHIYEVFENREKMVLVMEYAAGGELYDYLSKKKILLEDEARRIFRQIGSAVYYCHKYKICHRDLKLENILLDVNGNAKIADFGLSNIFDEQKLLTTYCGSPLYASPEIVRGTPYLGPEVDCWSLGVLLYTLVYGAMPFDGSNFKRLVKQISESDYFEPSSPSPASSLIREMLCTCPVRRANIEKICDHWWVNECYGQSCLAEAKELAAQTPVHLDLLLSLAPQLTTSENIVVDDQKSNITHVDDHNLGLTKCRSVGSFSELNRYNSLQKIQDISEEDMQLSTLENTKGKLEKNHSKDIISGREEEIERSQRQNKAEENRLKLYDPPSSHGSILSETRKLNSSEKKVIPKTEIGNQSSEYNNSISIGFTPNSENTTSRNETDESVSNTDSSVASRSRIMDEIKNTSNKPSEHLLKSNNERKSKMNETPKKLISVNSNEKVKKICIPGVNVGDTKRAFERKISLSSSTRSLTGKASSYKVTSDIDLNKVTERSGIASNDSVKVNVENKSAYKKTEDDKSQYNSINVTNGGISQSTSHYISDALLRNSDSKTQARTTIELPTKQNNTSTNGLDSTSFDKSNELKKCSTMQISLKSSTLPRSRKTSKAEITLAVAKLPEKKVDQNNIKIYPEDSFHSQKMQSSISDIASSFSSTGSSSRFEPFMKNRSFSQRMEPLLMGDNHHQNKLSSLSLMSPRFNQLFGKLSPHAPRHVNVDFDHNSGMKFSTRPEPIRKSPREYIIPIVMEDTEYIAPKSKSTESEGINSTNINSVFPTSRFDRLRKMNSFLGNLRDDDSSILSLHNEVDDRLRRNAHRMRYSRTSRHSSEHTDSFSSGEDDDDDDDGFELLTAENLFSTLLTRVRSLTQRLNVDKKNDIGSKFT